MTFIAQNNLLFLAPVNDPIFRADVPTPQTIPWNVDGQIREFNVTYYAPPAPVSVLGCVAKYQFCNSTPTDNLEDSCTSLRSWYGTRSELPLLNYNARQTAIWTRLAYAIQYNQIPHIINTLGDGILLANVLSEDNVVSTPLPSDQWVRELDHWFGIWMTAMQIQIVQYGTGTGSPVWDAYLTPPSPANASWMCTNQVVQNNNYASFNLLAIILILVFGSTIVVLNALLDPCVRFFRSRFRSGSGLGDRALAKSWRTHHVLQLQSALYESLGMGGAWDREALVPTTSEGETFGLPVLSGDERAGKLDRTRSASTGQESTLEPGEELGRYPHSKTRGVEKTRLLRVESAGPIVWENDIPGTVR